MIQHSQYQHSIKQLRQYSHQAPRPISALWKVTRNHQKIWAQFETVIAAKSKEVCDVLPFLPIIFSTDYLFNSFTAQLSSIYDIFNISFENIKKECAYKTKYALSSINNYIMALCFALKRPSLASNINITLIENSSALFKLSTEFNLPIPWIGKSYSNLLIACSKLPNICYKIYNSEYFSKIVIF
jgi:hypothetical protein